jgi:hypothetical protein
MLEGMARREEGQHGRIHQVPGVQGNSTEVSHLKWIEALSYHWAIGQGIGGPTPEYRNFDFTMEWHTAAQKLFSRAQTAEFIPEVRVDITRNTGRVQHTVMRGLLSDVHVLRAGGNPVEVTIAYRKIESERV